MKEEELQLITRKEKEDVSDEEEATHNVSDERESRRNHAAFFIFGICCNITYVIMLSAAFDLLNANRKQTKREIPLKSRFRCNNYSTGVVLFAAIFPTLLLKYTAPFVVQCCNYHVRFLIVVLMGMMSLLAPGLSTDINVIMFGVVCSSISSGFGEITYLSLTSHFKQTTVPCFTSGTGLAGLVSFAYAAITTAGFSPQNTILIFLISPVIQSVTFWFLLKPHPNSEISHLKDDRIFFHTCPGFDQENSMAKMTIPEKFKRIGFLWRYMLPLFLVYFAEYTINQGLFEMIYFNLTWMTQAEQYRWYYFTYNLGVFISRSSTTFYRVNNLWVPTLLQYGIFTLLLLQVLFPYIPDIFVCFAIILVEGLCGGAVYANAFLNVSEQIEETYREFSMGVTGAADSTGITIASLVSIQLHKVLCHYKKT